MPEIFLILRRIQQDIITNVKELFFLSHFNKMDFNRLFKNPQISNFMKNPSSGSRVVPCRQRDRQTDMMKLIAVFHNFANVPKNYTETVKHILINRCVMSNQMKSYYPEDTV